MRRQTSKVEYRAGRHNPHTLYVRPAGAEERGRDEIPIGFITDERAALLAASAMTAFSCLACPVGCASCTLDESNCECYDHQDDHPTDEELVTELANTPQAGALLAALTITTLIQEPRKGMVEERPTRDIAVDLLTALGGQGWRLARV
jgi:hypothetical protein